MSKQGSEMRDTPDTGTEPETAVRGERGEQGEEEGKEGKKRFDLSVPQVAGSALAAVVAAKLASSLGVYGTILGAGVISVIATCGGPVLQHFFKRTGEQFRGVTAQARPRPKPMAGAGAGAGRVPDPPVTSAYGAHGVREPYGARGPVADGEFGEPTTHGSRVRGWKRSALAAAAVFLLAMGGITAYELTSGQDFSGTKGSTTFGTVVRGGSAGGTQGDRSDHGDRSDPGDPSDRKGQGDRGDQGGTGQNLPSSGGSSATTSPGEQGGGTGTPAPGDTPGTGTGAGTPAPDGTTAPTPAPSDPAGPGRPTTVPPVAPPVAPPADGPASQGAATTG